MLDVISDGLCQSIRSYSLEYAEFHESIPCLGNILVIWRIHAIV
jgi:hypothetical protein